MIKEQTNEQKTKLKYIKCIVYNSIVYISLKKKQILSFLMKKTLKP